MSVTPVQHLLAWFTPVRRQLISSSALDRLAGRPAHRFSRFLAGEANTKFERVDLKLYYPVLQLLGYLPPGDVWVPQRPLTPAEASGKIEEWFTPQRRELISLRRVDMLSGRSPGVLGRYLSGEEHLTFKIIGIDVYYPALMLLGFEPDAKDMTISTDINSTADHLLTWFTPERRSFINSLTLDQAAGQPEGTLSKFLAGYRSGQRQLTKVGLDRYYPALAVLGYRPDLNLSKDESVQRHQARVAARPTN